MDDRFDPTPGVAEELEDGVRRILAPNPSPMTYRGTNTYLVGTGDLAIIDPGPASEDHYRAILAALGPHERITHVFVTHAHLDHSPLARPVADAFNAPVLAFGDARAGQSPINRRLAEAGLAGGGEGVDTGFVPDVWLGDGETVAGASWSLTALWTPGHFGNHLCFSWENKLFSGDLVMGWASSLVSPPDGDVADFMASLTRLTYRSDELFYPGHGAPIDDPAERIAWLAEHRRTRETELLRALEPGPSDIPSLTGQVYADIPASHLPAAERNLFAHLIDLVQKKRVLAEPELGLSATYRLR